NTDGLKLARSLAFSETSPHFTGSLPSVNLNIWGPAQTHTPPECAGAMRKAAEPKFCKTWNFPSRNTPTLRPLANHNTPSRPLASQQMLSPLGKSSLLVNASTFPASL